MVLSVTPTFVAFVALAADPSIETPVRLWLPVPRFNAMAVVPIYTVELPRTVDGMVPDSWPAGRLVRLAPDPLNPVAVKMPVEGLNWYFVDAVYSVDRLPVVWFHTTPK